MATHQELGQAIELIQAGNLQAGATMLNAVLRRPDLDNTNRAIGFVWLAETQDDIYFKIQCLNQAQDADPNNMAIRQRLNDLLAQQPSRTPYPTQRPTQPPQGQHSSANPYFPESRSINLPPPEKTKSQQVRQVGNQQPPPPPDNRRTTGKQRISDPEQRSRIMKRISPPNPTGDTGALPTLDTFDDRWTTGPIPAVNPNQGQYNPPRPSISDSQSINPFNQPNLDDSQPTSPFNQPPQQLNQSQRGAPHRLSQTPQVVGIKHGPNGDGSGVFVTRDGVIATTRYVVGGAEQVMVEVDTNYETVGRVIRTYPALDLALIHVNVQLDRVWPPINMPVIVDNESFVSISYGREVIRATHRKSKGQLSPHWIPTTAQLRNVKDAGGDVMYDTKNYLIGILTRNASRETGYVYGLHILHIYDKVNEYLRERQQMPNSGYCHHCGSMTRAEHYGGYYCETCGAVLPSAENIDRRNRTSQQLLQIYNENLSRTCPNCRAKVGYYNAKCLRCGYDLEGRL